MSFVLCDSSGICLSGCHRWKDRRLAIISDGAVWCC